MKNRQPSILYSSRGFLWPKLLTFTCHNTDKPLAYSLQKPKGFTEQKEKLPQSWAYSCLQDDPSRNNQGFSKEQLSVFHTILNTINTQIRRNNEKLKTTNKWVNTKQLKIQWPKTNHRNQQPPCVFAWYKA